MKISGVPGVLGVLAGAASLAGALTALNHTVHTELAKRTLNMFSCLSSSKGRPGDPMYDFEHDPNRWNLAIDGSVKPLGTQNVLVPYVWKDSTVLFFYGNDKRVVGHFSPDDIEENVHHIVESALGHGATTRVLAWAPNPDDVVRLGATLRAAMPKQASVTVMPLPQGDRPAGSYWNFAILGQSNLVAMSDMKAVDPVHIWGPCTKGGTTWFVGAGNRYYQNTKKAPDTVVTVAGVNGGAALFIFCPNGIVAANLGLVPHNGLSSVGSTNAHHITGYSLDQALDLAKRHRHRGQLRALLYAPDQRTFERVEKALKLNFPRLKMLPPEFYDYRANPADKWHFQIKGNAQKAEVLGGHVQTSHVTAGHHQPKRALPELEAPAGQAEVEEVARRTNVAIAVADRSLVSRAPPNAGSGEIDDTVGGSGDPDSHEPGDAVAAPGLAKRGWDWVWGWWRKRKPGLYPYVPLRLPSWRQSEPWREIIPPPTQVDPKRIRASLCKPPPGRKASVGPKTSLVAGHLVLAPGEWAHTPHQTRMLITGVNGGSAIFFIGRGGRVGAHITAPMPKHPLEEMKQIERAVKLAVKTKSVGLVIVFGPSDKMAMKVAQVAQDIFPAKVLVKAYVRALTYPFRPRDHDCWRFDLPAKFPLFPLLVEVGSAEPLPAVRTEKDER